MCPACLASAVLAIGGVLSASGVAAGGVAAAAAKLLSAGKVTRRIPSGEVQNREANEKEK
jgi:hypothetical protein